jgi:hypothetical protein
VWIW